MIDARNSLKELEEPQTDGLVSNIFSKRYGKTRTE